MTTVFFLFSYLLFCVHKYSALCSEVVLPLRNLLFTLCYFFCISAISSVLETLQCGALKEGLFSCLPRLSDMLFAEKV